MATSNDSHRAVGFGATVPVADLDRLLQSAVRELRLRFAGCGFDVCAYSDGDVCRAILHAAAPETASSGELLARAYERLHGGDPGPAGMGCLNGGNPLPARGGPPRQ